MKEEPVHSQRLKLRWVLRPSLFPMFLLYHFINSDKPGPLLRELSCLPG